MKVEKISFFSLESEAFSSLLDSMGTEVAEVARDAAGYYLSQCDEAELSFCVSCDSLLVRVFDYGRYSFIFPTPLSDGADALSAIDEVVRYCYLEGIEPVFCAVPTEDIPSFFTLGYRHVNLDADSPDADQYRVTLKNELSLADEPPYIDGGGISLYPLSDSDAAAFARLCRDEKTNELMGYNWNEDYPDADDSVFLQVAKTDIAYSQSLTLAVRAEGITVGDVAFHNFDYKGGADILVRILPEYRKRGYAKEAIALATDISKRLGLLTLYARIDNRNVASLHLFSRSFEMAEISEKITVYTYRI